MNPLIYKRLSLVLLILITLVTMHPIMAVGQDSSGNNAIQNDAARQQATGQIVSFIVILKDQVNPRTIGGSSRRDKARKILAALRGKADITQVLLRALLNTRRGEGRVSTFTPLWILNAIAVTGDSSLIAELSTRPEVDRVILDAAIPAPPPVTQTAPPPAVEPNLSLINAPALWNMGYSGQGVVIASLDTGVDINFQPDLQASWRGGTNSWFDPYGQHPTPVDLNGHGTWSMGLMVGGSSGGTSIGVAPQAKWISAKIFNDSGVASISAIHQSFQWLLNPGGNPNAPDPPDVVNNSWSLSAIGCNLDFEPDLQALVAADIVPVFAAGNFGPNGATDASPGNNPSAFSVGATDNNNVIATFSSRGATSCGRAAPSIYPAVVAPGVAVNTTDLFGLFTTASGTSFSAPHVTGAMALLLSANPNFTAAQLETALTASAADLGAAGPDNVFGAGRINALAAYNLLTGGGAPTPLPTPTITPSPMATDTPMPTNTPLPTDTATPTASPTLASSPTPTAPPSSTPTPTDTPAPSPTPTTVPSSTPTQPPPTPTSTDTPAPSPTNTAIPTQTPTPTLTQTPTATPSKTPTAAFTNTPTPGPDLIFADGFESGFSPWSTAVTNGGRLSVSPSAVLVGQQGMQAALGNTAAMYVAQIPSGGAIAEYHARFSFSPNGITLPSGSTTDIFIGQNSAGTTLLREQIQRGSASMYRVRVQVRLNSGSFTSSGWVTINNAAHAIEIAWKAASTANGSNGSASLWLDGGSQQTLSALTNGNGRIAQVRLGMPSGLTAGSSGSAYFDAFISTRTSYIGP